MTLQLARQAERNDHKSRDDVVEVPAFGWRPRWYQQEAWDSWRAGCLRQYLIWHRRAGKDDINLQMHAVATQERVGTYWHMLPMAAQARKAIWNAVNPHTGRRRIEEAFPDELVETRQEQEMFIRFKNGSTWQVLGSDNFNSLVGSPPIGLTFSEWALANPQALAYLMPILDENGGWCSLITTPRGNNHAKTLYDECKEDPKWFTQILGNDFTDAVNEETIESTRRVYRGMFGAEMADLLVDQEYYCSFAGAIIGSYFSVQVNKMERSGQIGRYPINRSYPIHTVWDLGISDNTAIWIFQIRPDGLYVVDFYQNNGHALSHYVDWLNDREYNTGYDFVPHDIMNQELGTGRTRWEVLRSLKRKPKRVPNVSLAEGIQASRVTLESAHIDNVNCADGIEALKHYRRDWDEEKKVFRDRPVHDWASHPADAWRYLSLAWRVLRPQLKKPEEKETTYRVDKFGRVVANVTVKEAVEAMILRKKVRD